jgi:2-polyprenyl-3-methyl-5-hydroxy-6-metoxy-1,4-benzoquinol methylase
MRDGVFTLTAGGYASTFGAQWREFARTQLDSANGTHISEARFGSVTGWQRGDLAGKTVLDVGCGAGRFAEVAISWGGKVTAVDLSEAVHAARANVRGGDRARFVQGNGMALPFPKRSFDFAFSIGVAQHTPDPLAYVRSVAECVKPGGQVAFWIYERTLRALLQPKYLLRPLTRRLPLRANRALATMLVSAFFPVAEVVARAPGPLRKVGLRALPIACYLGELPLPRESQREWSLLDTLDWYSPRYDAPQRYDEVERTLREAGATGVHRADVGGLGVRASF